MNISDAIQARQSIRSFKNKEVSKEIIEKISRDQIYDFMHEHYNPKKMVISAAGKVDHNKFVDEVISKLNNLPKGNMNTPEKAKFTSGEYREDKKLPYGSSN